MVDKTCFHRRNRPLNLVGHPSEVTEGDRGPWHIEDGGIPYGMAGIQRLELSQALRIRLDRVGQTEQQATTIHRCHRGPGWEGFFGGPDREIDVLGAGLCHIGNFHAVMGVEDLDNATGGRIDKLAADVEPLLHSGAPIPPWV